MVSITGVKMWRTGPVIVIGAPPMAVPMVPIPVVPIITSTIVAVPVMAVVAVATVVAIRNRTGGVHHRVVERVGRTRREGEGGDGGERENRGFHEGSRLRVVRWDDPCRRRIQKMFGLVPESPGPGGEASLGDHDDRKNFLVVARRTAQHGGHAGAQDEAGAHQTAAAAGPFQLHPQAVVG